MPFTVWGAFDSFRENVVDLKADEVSRARSSRDFLFTQLKGLDGSVPGFPKVHGKYLSFGSFARKTKKRPLDDIDFLFLLNGAGATAEQSPNDPFEYWLRLSEGAPLASFPDQYGFVNSTKVLNKIRNSLGSVSQYGHSEIKRTGEAIVLNLKSYPWAFDIVPAVPVGQNGETIYYLIPDGSGDWKRTDPRQDSALVTAVNGGHAGQFLPLLRVLKAWNERTIKPRLTSYYFENLAINVFQYGSPQFGSFAQGVQSFFQLCPSYLLASCFDPKGLGPDLDVNVALGTKKAIESAMNDAAQKACWATHHESRDEHAKAIAYWKAIFGPSFPGYG